VKAVLQDVVPDVDVLIKRVEDAARDSRNTDSCLGMVDLWRQNILIDSDMNICLLDCGSFKGQGYRYDADVFKIVASKR
jgi:hypothetical protein